MKTLNLVSQLKSEIDYTIQKFPDGQQNIVIKNRLPNLPIVMIKSRLNNFKDLELIICAVASLRELGVKEIHLYVPYILGARSDRKFELGGNRYIKDVLAPIINSLKFDSVNCVDPHSYVLENCINHFIQQNNIRLISYALCNLYKDFDLKFPKNDYLFVSPDAGAAHKIYTLSSLINYTNDIIYCTKERSNNGELTRVNVPINKSIHNKDFIIIDDICDGGQTFINIAKELKHNEFLLDDLGNFNNKIYLIVTHGIFSKGLDHVMKHFDGIFCTNSYSDILYVPDITDEVGAEHKIFKQLNIF